MRVDRGRGLDQHEDRCVGGERPGEPERRDRLVRARRDRRHATHLDDRERRGDGRRRLDHERDAARATVADEAKEPMERGAVDEHDLVEVEDDRAAVGQGRQLLLEVVDVREVELARERDQRDAEVGVRDVLELEGRHRQPR